MEIQPEPSRPDGNATPANGQKTGMAHILRALRYRNYRLFFTGQGISLVGTWLTRVATAWLVYRLVGPEKKALAAMWLGIVGFAGQIPMFLLAPIAGVLIDRWDRQRILVITQILAMLQSLALAILSLSQLITIPQVIALSIFQGLINAFDMPARQAFVVEMVENREDLGNAIALNSSMFNGARLIGPAVAGILIASVGEGMCFLIDAISYIAVIAALLAMHVKPISENHNHKHVWIELKEGFRYSFGFTPIRSLLLLMALISLVGMSAQVLMPIFANALSMPETGAQTFGLLMTAIGFGALIGAIYLAARRTVLGLGKVMAISGITLGASLIGFAISHWLWLALIFSAISGFGMIVVMAAANTILQTMIDDDKRGRVMSFFGMSVMGMAPFGSLLAGSLASTIGIIGTVVLSGIACLLGSTLFLLTLPALRKQVHPIYRRKGIIPEVVSGIQTADILDITQR